MKKMLTSSQATTPSITNKVGAVRGILIFTSIEIECVNYRFPTTSLVEAAAFLRILNYDVMAKSVRV